MIKPRVQSKIDVGSQKSSMSASLDHDYLTNPETLHNTILTMLIILTK